MNFQTKYRDRYWWNGLRRVFSLTAREDSEEIRYDFAIVQITEEEAEIVESQENLTFAEIEAVFAETKLPLAIYLHPKFRAAKFIASNTNNVLGEALGITSERKSDFIFETLPGTEEEYLVSIIRKEFYMEVIQHWEAYEERIVNITFSPERLLLGLGLLEADLNGRNVQSGGQLIVIEENKIIRAIEKEDESAFSLSELGRKHQFSERQFTLYLLVLTSILPFEILTSEPVPKNRSYQRLNKLMRIQRVAVLFLLVVFFVSYSIQLFKQKSLTVAQQIFEDNFDLINQINSNENKITDRQTFLSELAKGTLSSSRASWYLNEISRQVPDEISLDILSYRPSEELIKHAGFHEHSNSPDMLLKGKASSSASIANLANRLSYLDFISSHEIIEAEFEEREGNYRFLISINLNHV